jgi:cardiolipin synthase A/B
VEARVNLLVEPDDGFASILNQIKTAKQSIDTTIFRLDLAEVQKAFEAAVTRGVQVRALVAHTNSDGEKLLRKLEMDLLAAGVTLARSDDDLVRYHGKMLVVDGAFLDVMLFNYTRLDIRKSRSFAVVTDEEALVAEALRLFEADRTRQPYTPGLANFVVSPENSRARLSSLLRGATRQLLIYDPKLTDPLMIKILQERAARGVEVRVLGHIGKRAREVRTAKLAGLRLHARVIVADGTSAFLGSQSLRKAELDERREVGVIVDDGKIVRRLVEVFEGDWAQATASGKTGTEARETVAPEEPEP